MPMDKIRIQGGTPLKGEIPISAAKNAALKLMTASLLTEGKLVLRPVPDLRDTTTLRKILAGLGAAIDYDTNTKVLTIEAKNLTSHEAPYDLVRQMRASILVLGPLTARLGEAKVSLPGGCAIGARPVDMHLSGLEQMGATITLEEGYVHARAPADGLKGAHIHFRCVSVGATEHLMMTATLAKGTTTLVNAAREPEIIDLGHGLIAMGAEIEGLGTDTITIHGKPELHGTEHTIVGDRIEAGTYAIAAAMTGGPLKLTGINIAHLEYLIEPLHLAGADMIGDENSIIVRRTRDALRGVDIMTEPYPGFPTDLQAQFMAMLTTCEGAGMITETIFENRFMHVPELTRMGANITVHGSSALVRGVPKLKGAPVMATDLRASVSLVLAGLVAEGTTTVHRIYHLDRGYEDIIGKLTKVGAKMERLHDEAA